MRRLFVCLALLSHGVVAIAGDSLDAVRIDAEEVALSFGQGRVQWRFEALDVLELPVVEPFGGFALDKEVLLAQELTGLEFDLDGERRIFLSVTINW